MPAAVFAARRADLDWLRVLAFGLLILYHAGMAWSGWNWHVTSTDDIAWLREVMRFLNRWRMPLIFVVSGAAIMLALGARTPGAFVVDRLKRLLLPLVFGMLVLVPPQVYLERLYRGQFTGSFFEWLPRALRWCLPQWQHELASSLVRGLCPGTHARPAAVLPLGAQRLGQAAQDAAGRFIARTGLQWAMALPLAAATLWLAPISHNTNGLIGDWYGPRLLRGVAALRRVPVRLAGTPHGVAAAAPCLAGDEHRGLRLSVRGVLCRGCPADHRAGAAARLFLLSAINTMAWLFTILGFGHRYFTRRPAFLAEATEAVYPFYLIHQTVAVIVVYWLLAAGASAGGWFHPDHTGDLPGHLVCLCRARASLGLDKAAVRHEAVESAGAGGFALPRTASL